MITSDHAFELQPITEPVYDWIDHSRFVEVYPVSTGWLVIWGRYEEMGAVRTLADGATGLWEANAVRTLAGSRIYRTAEGARRRLAWAVVGFTKNPVDARDALRSLDRQGGLPAHRPREIQAAESDPS